MRRSRGNPPPFEDGWVRWGKVLDVDGPLVYAGTEWSIYGKRYKGLLNLKVVADGRAEGRGNYWVSVEIGEDRKFKRWVGSYDLAEFKRAVPLYEEVELRILAESQKFTDSLELL